MFSYLLFIMLMSGGPREVSDEVRGEARILLCCRRRKESVPLRVFDFFELLQKNFLLEGSSFESSSAGGEACDASPDMDVVLGAHSTVRRVRTGERWFQRKPRPRPGQPEASERSRMAGQSVAVQP